MTVIATIESALNTYMISHVSFNRSGFIVVACEILPMDLHPFSFSALSAPDPYWSGTRNEINHPAVASPETPFP